MTVSDIERYIDKMLSAYPSIQTIVYTGGEVFCLGTENILHCIKYAKSKGVKNIRIVTNAIWASSKEKAKIIINRMAECGLTELNISTGDEHAIFTPLEYVYNVIDSFLSSKLDSLSIAIEKSNLSVINADSLLNGYYERSNIH